MKSLLIALSEIAPQIILIQRTQELQYMVQLNTPYNETLHSLIISKFKELEPDFNLDIEEQIGEGEYLKQLPRQYGVLETICIEIKI